CGEHYVAAFLAGHNLVVALPRGGASRADLFVADSSRGRAIRVQVKSGRQAFTQYKKKWNGQGCYSWDADRRIVCTHGEGLWFAYVSLEGWPESDAPPAVFFLPSSAVAQKLASQTATAREFLWMFEADLEPYRGANGVALLKSALKAPCPAP